MIAVAAASGAMAVTVPVYADSAADGAAGGSPGLISGNGIQLPVHVPVNVCGNTVNVVGLLNPAAGNRCANAGGDAVRKDERAETPAGAAETPAGAVAHGVETDSPGVVSGNGIQLPVDLPVNVSGNSVNVVGIGNPVFGNQSVNTPAHPDEPGRSTPPPAEPTPPTRAVPPAQPKPHASRPATPVPTPPTVRQRTPGTLAHTGADGTWAAAAASMASLVGGAVLYRRFRSRATGRQG
ncbi:chaplin [Streptomyces actinomycinicus]|uniref:Chaplin n=1 Tax=Streptomyces actinomycinicus TaxID=1695166 RepID=A0A937EMR4_9ACTN|nr:chaplin [Streptomyces actinomycinicus]